MMSSYSPAGCQPRSFKLSLLERSLARFECYAVRCSGALAWLAAREELHDLGVVLGRVDIVRAPRRRNHVEQLRVPLQDLARAGVAFQRHELVPQLACEDHRRRPFT